MALIESAPAVLFVPGRTSRRCLEGQNCVSGSSWVKPMRLVCWRGACSRSSGIRLTSPSEDLLAAVMATYSTLWMQGRHCRIHVPIDTVVIHGRADLELAIKPEMFRERTGARLLRCGEPGYELAGAASERLWPIYYTSTNGLNLARGFKPPVPIREIFPWGELALQGALVAGVSLFLHAGSVELETQLKTTQVASQKYFHGSRTRIRPSWKPRRKSSMSGYRLSRRFIAAEWTGPRSSGRSPASPPAPPWSLPFRGITKRKSRARARPLPGARWSSASRPPWAARARSRVRSTSSSPRCDSRSL